MSKGKEALCWDIVGKGGKGELSELSGKEGHGREGWQAGHTMVVGRQGMG